jgi:hypothetical protein
MTKNKFFVFRKREMSRSVTKIMQEKIICELCKTCLCVDSHAMILQYLHFSNTNFSDAND